MLDRLTEHRSIDKPSIPNRRYVRAGEIIVRVRWGDPSGGGGRSPGIHRRVEDGIGQGSINREPTTNVERSGSGRQKGTLSRRKGNF